MPVKQSADDVEMPCELWVSKWPTSPFVQDCIAGNGSSGWPESCNAAGICANCRLQWFRAAYRWFKGILSAGSLATCQIQSVPGHSVGRMPCIGSRGPNECSEHVLHVAAQTSAFQNVRIVFEPLSQKFLPLATAMAKAVWPCAVPTSGLQRRITKASRFLGVV